MNVPRAGFGVVCADDYVIIAGGVMKDTFGKSAIKMDLNTFKMEEIPAMQVNRFVFTLLEVPRYNLNA